MLALRGGVGCPTRRATHAHVANGPAPVLPPAVESLAPDWTRLHPSGCLQERFKAVYGNK